MKLKYRVTSLDSVDEAFRSLYIQQTDGSFTLGVEGAVDKSQLDEFRNNNNTLKQGKDELQTQLQALTDKMQGIDPEQAREALEMMSKIRDQKLIEEGKIEELIEARTKDMLTNHQLRETELTNQVAAGKSTFDALQGNYRKLKIGADILGALGKVGSLHENSRDLVTELAAQTWQLNDKDALIAMKGDQKLYSATDATKPMSPEEWCTQLATDRPYLFERTTSLGGGNGGNGGNGGSHVKGVISSDDQQAFEDNLEAIAAGEVQVR